MIARDWEYLVVVEQFSPSGMSLIAVPNPTQDRPPRADGMDVSWWVYGIGAESELCFDRRLVVQAVQRFFSGDFAAAQLVASIAAEAGLNRFRRSLTGVRAGSSLEPKLNAAIGWCRTHDDEAASRLQALREDILVELKVPRDSFAHGDELPGDAMATSRALRSITTAVKLLSEVERIVTSERAPSDA